jgi:hypothetical protein
MKTEIVFICLAAMGNALLFAGDKAAAINEATVLIADWKEEKIETLETRIAAITEVDSLRTLAFFSRGAAYPQNAEDNEIDAKLDRIFWASVKALLKQDNHRADASLRVIERSNLLQGGDLLLFRELKEQAKEGK